MGQFEALFDYGFLAVGLCAVVYAVVSLVRIRAFVRCSVEVNGEVIRLERSESRGRYGYTYAPVFTYTTVEGIEHTVTSEVGSSPAGFSEGDVVRVRYDPANPEDARIHSFFQTWGTPIVSGVVGVFLTCFACRTLGFFHFAG